MKRLHLLLLLLALGLLVACGSHNVKSATLRDTIFSVEEINNGSYRVWFTHDDIAGYCTASEELGQKALTLLKEHDGEVAADFRTITDADKESSWWNKSGCGSISTGSDSSTAMFLLTDIRKAPSR